MELSEIWSSRINTVVNSCVSQSLSCAEGDFFDWEVLDHVVESQKINFERDGLALLLAAAAQMGTVIALYAEDVGVDPVEMHAEFVKGIEGSGPGPA